MTEYAFDVKDFWKWRKEQKAKRKWVKTYQKKDGTGRVWFDDGSSESFKNEQEKVELQYEVSNPYIFEHICGVSFIVPRGKGY